MGSRVHASATKKSDEGPVAAGVGAPAAFTTFPVYVYADLNAVPIGINTATLAAITTDRLQLYNQYSKTVSQDFVSSIPDLLATPAGTPSVVFRPGIGEIEVHYNILAVHEALKIAFPTIIEAFIKEIKRLRAASSDTDKKMMLEMYSFYAASTDMSALARMSSLAKALCALPAVIYGAVCCQVVYTVLESCNAFNYQIDSGTGEEVPSEFLTAKLAYSQEIAGYSEILKKHLKEILCSYAEAMNFAIREPQYALLTKFMDLFKIDSKTVDTVVATAIQTAEAPYEYALRLAQTDHSVRKICHMRSAIAGRMPSGEIARVLTVVPNLDTHVAVRLLECTTELYSSFSSVDEVKTNPFPETFTWAGEDICEGFLRNPAVYDAHCYLSSSKLEAITLNFRQKDADGTEKIESKTLFVLPFLWSGSFVTPFLLMNDKRVIVAAAQFQLALHRGNDSDKVKYAKRLDVSIKCSAQLLAMRAKRRGCLRLAADLAEIEFSQMEQIKRHLLQHAFYAKESRLQAIEERFDHARWIDVIKKRAEKYYDISAKSYISPNLVSEFIRDEEAFARSAITVQHELFLTTHTETTERQKLQAAHLREREGLFSKFHSRALIMAQRAKRTVYAQAYARSLNVYKKQEQLEAREFAKRGTLSATETTQRHILKIARVLDTEILARIKLTTEMTTERQALLSRKHLLRTELVETHARAKIQQDEAKVFRMMTTRFYRAEAAVLQTRALLESERLGRLGIESEYAQLSGEHAVGLARVPSPPPAPPIPVTSQLVPTARELHSPCSAAATSGSPSKTDLSLRSAEFFPQRTLVRPEEFPCDEFFSHYETIWCEARCSLLDCLGYTKAQKLHPKFKSMLATHGVTFAELTWLYRPPPEQRVPLGFRPDQFQALCLGLASILPADVTCYLMVYGSAADFYSSSPRKLQSKRESAAVLAEEKHSIVTVAGEESKLASAFRAYGSEMAGLAGECSDIDMALYFVDGKRELPIDCGWYDAKNSATLMKSSFSVRGADSSRLLSAAGLWQEETKKAMGYWRFKEIPYDISFSLRTQDNPVLQHYRPHRIFIKLR